jgi:two-component system NtrC family sensor kinase
LQSLDLTIARGPGKGQSVRVPGDRAFSIGRGHSNDLTLADRLVSSHHARIQVEGGYFVLTDLNSKNHTYVNGTAISGAVILRDQDQVGIGNCLIVCREATGAAVQFTDRPDDRPIKASIETGKTVAIDANTIKTAITHFGRAERNLAVLHATGKLLAEDREPAEFLPALLDMMFDVVPADRGAVFVADKGEMRPIHARDAKGKPLQNLSISRTVLRRAVEEGCSVLTGAGFAGADASAQESIVLHQIASAMCAPIRGRDHVVGALYLDSKITGKAFEQEDLELLTTVAAQAGMAHENARLARDSARAERMAAIGVVVAGLAHDIKNYMAGLQLAQDLVEPEIREKCSSSGGEAWDAMKDAQKRMTDLVQDMLAYSKPRDPEWALADPNQVLGQAAKAVQRRADERGVLVDVKRSPKIGLWWMDPRALDRCLVNLAGNGIDATPGGGTVTLKAAPGADGNALEITVADTGAGIPPEARGAIFDLMFSTKGSKGTGLGLAVTKKIIEEHGGTITFTTEVNEGTSFLISLPRHEQRPVGRPEGPG